MRSKTRRFVSGRPSRSVVPVLAFAALCTQSVAQAVRVQAPHIAKPDLLTSTLSVSASPATVNFTLQSGRVSSGSQPVSITSSWLLGVAATVHLYAYFGSTAALTNTASATNSIASTHVLGLCSTGQVSTYTPFTQAGPFGAGTSLQLFQQAGAVSLLVTRTDQLSLQIDLSSQPQLPAGQYTGTLILQAQAL